MAKGVPTARSQRYKATHKAKEKIISTSSTSCNDGLPLLISISEKPITQAEGAQRVLNELLIYRCSTPFSIMNTAATMVVPHTAKGVAHDKRWAMEDAVYSSRPRFIRFRSE
jgi:hypothetical protein